MKKVHIKSAIPVYIAAGVWLFAGIISPGLLLKLPSLVAVILISAIAGMLSGKVFPGRTIEVQDAIRTGDAALDQDIAEGRVRLDNLHRANAAIEDAEISRNLDRMTAAGEQVFQELGRDKRKLALVRRFMNYYLPTAEKLMDQYQLMINVPSRGENILVSMERIKNSLGMIADAFEKCLDNLYADQEMDIDAEIKVMQTMLASDGLIKTTENNIQDLREKNQRPFSMGE